MGALLLVAQYSYSRKSKSDIYDLRTLDGCWLSEKMPENGEIWKNPATLCSRLWSSDKEKYAEIKKSFSIGPVQIVFFVTGFRPN